MSCALASMLRRSWLILLTARPSCGQPVLLRQKPRQLALHLRELALGRADLVEAAGRHDDAARILRIWLKRSMLRVSRIIGRTSRR